MFIEDLFVIGKNWKQLNVLKQVNEINKLGYMYTIEYYAAIKSNDLVVHKKMDESHSSCAE